MFNTKCACGKSNKNFKYDIGPSYVADCCSAAGYDDLGVRKSSGNNPIVPGNVITGDMISQSPSIPAQQTEVSTSEQLKPSAADRVLAFLGVNSKALSKSKIEKLRVDELRQIAADRGIQGCEDMTRAQLAEVLLK